MVSSHLVVIAYNAYSTLNTVLKCFKPRRSNGSNTNCNARAATFVLQGGIIKLSAASRPQQWPQQAAAQDTALARAADSSSSQSAQAAAIAAELSEKRRPEYKLQNWWHRAGYNTGRSNRFSTNCSAHVAAVTVTGCYSGYCAKSEQHIAVMFATLQLQHRLQHCPQRAGYTTYCNTGYSAQTTP